MYEETCDFCRIACNKDPEASRKIHEDNFCYCMIASHPITPGNIMVIPKKHYATVNSLKREEKIQFFLTALRLAELLIARLGAKGYFLKYNDRVYLAEPREKRHISHIHIHLIPRYSFQDKVWEKPQPANRKYFIEIKRKLENLGK